MPFVHINDIKSIKQQYAKLKCPLIYLKEAPVEVAKLAVGQVGEQVNDVAEKITESLTTEEIKELKIVISLIEESLNSSIDKIKAEINNKEEENIGYN